MNWREELRSNITKAEELRGYLKLSDEETSRLEAILEHFPMTITRYYLSLINWDDPKDPIRRMCIPSIEENDMTGKFDTSGEADNTILPGLQHKYNETVLILSTHRWRHGTAVTVSENAWWGSPTTRPPITWRRWPITSGARGNQQRAHFRRRRLLKQQCGDPPLSGTVQRYRTSGPDPFRNQNAGCAPRPDLRRPRAS